MDLENLNREIKKLRSENEAFKAQSKLLANFIDIAKSSSEEKLLKLALQKTLQLTEELTGAEIGSLFLLKEDSTVSESILTSEDVSNKKRSNLIGKAMDTGIAGWVAKKREVALIHDTNKDDRWVDFKNQSYVVRSVLSIPILRGEYLMGILTLQHSKPKHFTEEQSELMKLLSEQVACVLENVSLYAKLEESQMEILKQNQEMEEDLILAEEIQKHFISSHESPAYMNVSLFYKPHSHVSGYSYYLDEIEENSAILFIGDAMGHGVAAALTTIMANIAIEESADVINPIGTVEHINDILMQNLPAGRYMSGILIAVQKSGMIKCVNAGHPPAIIIPADGSDLVFLNSSDAPMGIFEKSSLEYKESSQQLKDGDMLVLYTDGISEASNPSGKMYGEKRFFTLLEKNRNKSNEELIKSVMKDVETFVKGTPFNDDITILAFQFSATK
ncbi:MAG: SpoIIE family protein phosphatase [Nitrospinae bacterium]|nr:SpoIIE family protein phosphatase [Nitrospinota bacterium]